METEFNSGEKNVFLNDIKKNAARIDDSLRKVKICDPAIGSGAFPVGMMNEILKARKLINFYIQRDESDYEIKRNIIQNCLYGVDIDSGAIEIAKLRLWLSLVVDEDDFENIQALPNLAYRIMQGNSLIEDFHGVNIDIGQKGQANLWEDDTFAKSVKRLHLLQNGRMFATKRFFIISGMKQLNI